jgi:disulfide bond formation protein DsbB
MKQILNCLNWMQGDGRRAALFAALASAGLLAAAYFFQYVVKLLPCELCYWQRKPHFAIIPLGLLGFFLMQARWRFVVLGLIVLAALTNTGISIFHVGVEHHWWQGLSTCSAPTAVTRTIEEARNLIFNSTVVPCDKPAWVFLGISMAGWNGLASLAIALWAALGARRSWRAA